MYVSVCPCVCVPQCPNTESSRIPAFSEQNRSLQGFLLEVWRLQVWACQSHEEGTEHAARCNSVGDLSCADCGVLDTHLQAQVAPLEGWRDFPGVESPHSRRSFGCAKKFRGRPKVNPACFERTEFENGCRVRSKWGGLLDAKSTVLVSPTRRIPRISSQALLGACLFVGVPLTMICYIFVLIQLPGSWHQSVGRQRWPPRTSFLRAGFWAFVSFLLANLCGFGHLQHSGTHCELRTCLPPPPPPTPAATACLLWPPTWISFFWGVSP